MFARTESFHRTRVHRAMLVIRALRALPLPRPNPPRLFIPHGARVFARHARIRADAYFSAFLCNCMDKSRNMSYREATSTMKGLKVRTRRSVVFFSTISLASCKFEMTLPSCNVNHSYDAAIAFLDTQVFIPSCAKLRSPVTSYHPDVCVFA